jgi:hypothetical protein
MKLGESPNLMKDNSSISGGDFAVNRSPEIIDVAIWLVDHINRTE